MLNDKVVVMTGAAGGLGGAQAKLLAQAGAKLVLNDIGWDESYENQSRERLESLGEELRASGAQVALVHGDAADPAVAESLVATAQQEFGRIDGLVTNTGIGGEATLLRITPEQWRACHHHHLDATFFPLQAVAKALVQQKQGGKIVLTTGVAGLFGNFGQSAYASAAAGIYGLMRSACIELQKKQIFVNAVAPLAKTPLTAHLPMFAHVDTMGPEHVAPAVLYLLSNESQKRTGHVIGAAGARLYAYKFIEGGGSFKDEGDPWTAEEIHENWSGIASAKA